MLQRALFEEARERLQPGDVIAFGGHSLLSRLIKWWTRSVVSHVGCVCFPPGGGKPHVVESTRIKGGVDGVNVTPLEKRMDYAGDVWWLPLSREVRRTFDEEAFNAAIVEFLGRSFDWIDFIRAGVDWFDRVPLLCSLTLGAHDARKFFCSELTVTLLNQAKVLPPLRAAEIQPIEVCQFRIYEPDCFQLKGAAREIRGFNEVPLC